ncbi:MAG TPA: trehalose-phosphatase [Casimicrobiaceae bacterium]|nr:trehalose-phosphatase [Casimicrobiaceae bacterium]
MIYAFSRDGIACIAAIMTTRPLLAFDIDGTLAPIVDDPGGARLPADIQQCLATLARRYDVAIVTGRAVEDARRMFAFEPRYLVGNHGAEGIPRWAERSQAYVRTVHGWREALETCEALDATGVTIEDKRYSLSLHYRRAPDRGAAHRAIRACVERLEPAATIIDGKAVVNLLPPGAPDKGDAVRALIDETQRPTAFYVGDDDTDEAVFGLHLPSVVTVRVEPSDDSQATLFLRDQREVLTLLQHIARL